MSIVTELGRTLRKGSSGSSGRDGRIGAAKLTWGPYNAWNIRVRNPNYKGPGKQPAYTSWSQAINGVTGLIAGPLYFGAGRTTTSTIYPTYQGPYPGRLARVCQRERRLHRVLPRILAHPRGETADASDSEFPVLPDSHGRRRAQPWRGNQHRAPASRRNGRRPVDNRGQSGDAGTVGEIVHVAAAGAESSSARHGGCFRAD